MTKLWDDLKHNMKDWSNAAIEKAEEVSKVAVAKTEELTKVSKIKIEVHQLQRDIRNEKELLGKLVYNQAKENNMANFTGNNDFFSHIQKIDQIEESIKLKLNKIDKLYEKYDITEEKVRLKNHLN